MVIVYEAKQQKPVRRKVALKLIKWGMDTKAVVARFDSERQALALMNHPSIASVYDAGTIREGPTSRWSTCTGFPSPSTAPSTD
jgi:serine/threonine protein kinase